MAKFLSDMIAKLEAKYRKKRQQKEEDDKADESTKKKREKSEDQKSEEDEDEEDMLVEPGPWSKTFVLVLLLSYMALSALGCSVFTNTSWNFLDSFYFCLITMVKSFKIKDFVNSCKLKIVQ
jgi:hypothetical protein